MELICLQEKDFNIIKEIYDYYILHSTITFHLEPLSVEALKEFIPMNHPLYTSYLITEDGKACGYCYIGPFSKRPAYFRTAEITIYLKPDATHKGIGKQVLEKLTKIAKAKGIKVLLGGITATNIPSIRLFESCGFEKCAHYKQVGEKFNQVLDVVFYQKILGN